MITILKSILATVVYIIIMELTGLWIFVPQNLGIAGYDQFYYLIQGICQLLLTIVFVYLVNRRNPWEIWKRASVDWYLIAGLLGCLFIPLQSLLNWIYNFLFGTAYRIVYDFDGISELENINILATILLVPVAEELFFRGYLQHSLQEKLKPWSAILVASILFAAIHAPYSQLILSDYPNDWHLFYITIFLGMISGTIYYKSGSVGSSIMFHVFANLMAVIV